jgi:hypothetical protein
MAFAGMGRMVTEEGAEREALASALRDAGWAYVNWDTQNRAWQFQGAMTHEESDDWSRPFFVCFRSAHDPHSCRVVKRYAIQPRAEDAREAGEAWAEALGEERGSIEVWRNDEMTARQACTYPERPPRGSGGGVGGAL